MEKIILDCDPGHDDALAIMLAAGNPDIDLLGITTVAGNQTLPKVTHNALSVCAVAGIDVPVAAGSAGPLVGEQVVAPDIHGESGLDGPVLPAPAADIDDRDAVDFIVDTVMEHDAGTVHLVPVGPCTNIALAMRKRPEIIGRVKSVVLMGGGYTRGNTTPTAEFNIYADPEAAEAVFAGEWPVTMVPLDLTHQATATDDVFEAVSAIGGELSEFVVEVLRFFQSTYLERQGFEYPPVHDPVCVASLIDPSVFTTESAFVTVERRGEFTRGMTVTDFADLLGRSHNTSVAITLDKPKFWSLVIDALQRLTDARDG